MSKTMRAVKWYGPRDLRLAEAPMPEPGPGEALIRVETTGICGSDMHYYAEGRIGNNVVDEEIILGHEFAGIVEDVYDDADGDLIGQRVAVEPGIPCGACEWCRKGRYNVCQSMRFPGGPGVNGSLCDFITAPAKNCYPVPRSFSADAAAMMEPLAVAVHSVELARIEPGDTVAILGLGPVGLLTAQAAKAAGVERVFGTDLHEYRVGAGAANGVDAAFIAGIDAETAIMDETGGRGVDIVIDCARSGDTPAIACRIARPAGRIVLTGISGNEEDAFAVGHARRKELSMTWCRRFLFNFPASIALAAQGRVDVESMVTHHFPLEQTPEAFEMVDHARDGVLKAAVDN
jgi:L-iditol 2-dehydrogenase